MSEEEKEALPAPGPELMSIKGGKARKKSSRGYSNIDRDLYDKMAEVYLHGKRNIQGLAKACGVAHKTAKKAIELGWPDREWGPLMERARLYDKLHSEGQQTTSPARAKQARDWTKMRDDFIEIAAGARIVLAKSIIVLQRNVDQAVATRLAPQRQIHFEEILDAKGRVTRRIPHTVTVDVMLAPDIHAITSSINQIAGALDRIGGGELEQLMARPPSTGRRGHKLSPEQIEYMATNQGKLPPGVKMEDLGDV